jgi:hypothetical protein
MSWFLIPQSSAIFVVGAIFWISMMILLALTTHSESLPCISSFLLGTGMGIGTCLCGIPAYFNYIVANRNGDSNQFQWVEDEFYFFASVACFSSGFLVAIYCARQLSINVTDIV